MRPGLALRQVGPAATASSSPATGFFAGAAPAFAGAAFPCARRMSAASSLISVRSRCISLQPYHSA